MGKIKDHFAKKKQRKQEIAAAKAQAKEQGDFRPGLFDKLFGGIKGTVDNVKAISGMVGSVMDVVTRVKENKPHIDRRLTLIFIFISLITAIVTAVNFVVSGALERIAFGWNIAVYTVIALYVPVIIALLVAETVYRKNITLKTTEKYNKFLKVMRIVIRIVAFVISVLSLVISAMIGDVEGKALAVDILARVFSIVTIICSLLPSASSIITKFVNWLISPVNGKVSFGWVAGLWKENVDALASAKKKGEDTFNADQVVKLQSARRYKSLKRVNAERAQELYDTIDENIVKGFKGKYIINIRESDVYNAVESAPEELRVDIFENVDSIFDFAIEREIIAENPCVGLRDCYSLSKKAAVESASPVEGIFGKIFGKKQ
ncbi:MAG: hypothetical protein ACI4MH_05570 [Candidatus Coproplasma sp.]